MKPTIAACLGVCLVALMPPGSALGDGVRPRINYVHYSVPYTPGLSVTEMILRHSPLSSQGRRFSGYTSYDMKYEINYGQPSIDICSIDSFQVFCDCEITLPRLDGGEVDPEARRLFAVELKRIERHEQTHCDIAVRHAEALLAGMRKLKAMPCLEADATVSERLQKAMADCAVDQARFDHAEYGYKDHLRVAAPRWMTDAGSRDASPSKAAHRPGSGTEARPGNLQSVAPPGAQELKRKGIYKDENGVWRNY